MHTSNSVVVIRNLSFSVNLLFFLLLSVSICLTLTFSCASHLSNQSTLILFPAVEIIGLITHF